MPEAPFDNRLRRTLRPLARWPAGIGVPLRSFLIGRTIPFVGTAGLRIERLDEHGVVVYLANRHRVRNHISTLHAAAMALLAETASGLALGMHVRDDAIPVIQRMTVHYEKRAQGAMRAEAKIPDEEAARLHVESRGELLVPVTVTDAAGQPPIRCEMLWAWRPKQREHLEAK